MPKQVGEELIDKLLREIMGEVSQQAQQQRFVPEYLSERQRQYFQQRTPQKQERIAMTGQTIPIPSRQQAQPQQQRPRVDVREELRQALLQNQMDVEKESRAEERKIAEEQRKSAQKEQENKQKRTQELQDKLATAQTDRERVGYQRQLAEMGAAPPPPDLTPEEIAEITQVVEVGPDRLKDIDAKQNWIRDAEHTYNLHMNDPEISPEEAESFWDRLGELQTEYRELEREKRKIQAGLARGEQLEQYKAQQELEARAAQEAELEQAREVEEMAEIERKFEEREKRPVETREEEAARELGEEGAKAEVTTAARERAREPFRQEAEKRKQKQKQAEDERKLLRDKQLASFRAGLAGDKSEDTALRNFIYREYNKKPEKWYEWQTKMDSYEEEENLYSRAMVKAEEEGRPEDAEKMKEKRDAARAARLTAARQEPKRAEDFSTFYDKRMKELKKQVKGGTGKPTPAQPTTYDETTRQKLRQAGLTDDQITTLIDGAKSGDADYIATLNRYLGR